MALTTSAPAWQLRAMVGRDAKALGMMCVALSLNVMFQVPSG